MYPYKKWLFFIFFIILPFALFARNVEIIVEDEELELPLEGAVISLRSGQQFTCDEEGRALVTLPDDRQAIVQISYPGYDTLRLVIPAAGETSQPIKALLRLGGIMVARELVVEAERPEASETKTGRSVAISDRELTRTAEIGIVEDVMSSVKLLPGVGYTGMFSAMPSIRGGDPGDLMASLDGFYIELPYHWGGSVSIFDPKMVSSARLSHGVFSSRYGHTTSGLLEVTSKTPSTTETEMETGISTSAASLNLSYPLNGKGGIMVMGRVTYWDTLVWAAQGLSKVIDNENLDMVNGITTSPYIRSLSLSSNYRFTPNLEWRLNGFFGADGIGADIKTAYDSEGISGAMEAAAKLDNYQGFIISGISASPNPKLALRLSGGAGFMQTVTIDSINNDVTVRYNQDFLDKYIFLQDDYGKDTNDSYTAPNVNVDVDFDSTAVTGQLRFDADWELGKGFIAAFGVQELYSMWRRRGDLGFGFIESRISDLPDIPQALFFAQFPELQGYPELSFVRRFEYRIDAHNHGFTTSAYSLVEYMSPKQRINVELGLRLDHMFFLTKDITVPVKPAFNPRLNIDFNLLKNSNNIDSLDLSLGTGFFSSMDKFFTFFDADMFKLKQSDMDNLEAKFNRTWTSVIGLKLDMFQKYTFNIEAYYKKVFDRAYITAETLVEGDFYPTFHFNGQGNVYGFDLQLQKLESRYIDGWISYSFNWTKYYNPDGGGNTFGLGGTDTIAGEFWPSFHRFNNCNIVLNVKPLRWFNIGIRFGFASGQPQRKSGDKYSYPVLLLDDNFMPTMDEKGNPVIVQKYSSDSFYDDKERSAWSLPFDIKFSFFKHDRKGRVSTEIYLAAENISSLFFKPTRSSLNEYTGKYEQSADSDTFDLPIPMISFGFKWRY